MFELIEVYVMHPLPRESDYPAGLPIYLPFVYTPDKNLSTSIEP